MSTPTTLRAAPPVWRVTPLAWVPIALAIAAEAISNALRAYALGEHLDRFTLTIAGQPVSIAGAVLVLAAIAVSLSQARAAWVALTPSGPARQRIVAGAAALLLLSISITAMASHILEAQRAKISDEGGERKRYDRAEKDYKDAAAELEKLGNPRPVSVVQAEVAATKIDMVVWRRSQQCADISLDATKVACAPILALYIERGNAARKAELEPKVERLRLELAGLKRPEEATASEGAVSGVWGWIMGLGVVVIATFGTVIFARVEPAAVKPALTAAAPATDLAATDADLETVRRLVVVSDNGNRPSGGTPAPRRDGPSPTSPEGALLAHVLTEVALNRDIPSQASLCRQYGLPKQTVSDWVRGWERNGLIPARRTVGRCKALVAG